METRLKIRRIFFEATALALILLFCYAATSKIIDFHNFQVQLSQSPMTSAFSDQISYAVPISEFTIVLLLALKRFRVAGMYLSFALMAAFTSYIFIILNYSAYVPCSCGGVLEKLGWQEHFFFNIFFILLPVLAILFEPPEVRKSTVHKKQQGLKSKLAFLGILFFSAVLSTSLFYNFSEEKMQFRNSFVRRFPPHMSDRLNDIDLRYNSYYLAGIGNGKLYLGNTTTPLYVTVLDTALNLLGVEAIKLDQPHAGMRQPQVRVAPPELYVYEGSIPYLYRGSTDTWKSTLHATAIAPFSQLQPLDFGRVAVRFNSKIGSAPAIGTINLAESGTKKSPTWLLDSTGQDDAIFRADGVLAADAKASRLHYVYYYQNRFVISTSNFKSILHGRTIDTVATPVLKLVRLEGKKEKTFSKMPLLVNRIAAADSGWLFVNSQLRGRHDPDYLWKSASLLDIYDTRTGAYLATTFLHHIEGRKIGSFLVSDRYIYSLSGRHLVRYVLRRELLHPRR